MTHRSSAGAKTLKLNQARSHDPALDLVLLGLCLGLLALRCTVTESPASRLSTLATNLHDLAYSLTLSLVLLFAAGLWAIRALHGKARMCQTYLEWGICLFVTGGLTATCFASDKRTAVSDLLILAAPMVMAWLLIQLLNTPAKIRLTLALVAVLGLLSAFESYSQFSSVNQETITAYEQNPAQFLDPLGLSPGTLEHFLFEHRLYSQGVRSFFTTRNSNGSFLLMAVLAALALAIEGAVQYRHKHNTLVYPIAALLVALINLNALILTKSKGALGGLVLACLGISLVYLTGPILKRHTKAILTICILSLMAAAGVLIHFGRTHDTLPGGNSLLVRWQYWQATMHMIEQHPWFGVGPGNFAHLYHQYKAAASPESVSDPHNVVLSLLSQYGPLGLIGFILTLAWPLAVIIRWDQRAVSPEPNGTDAFRKKLYWSTTFAVCTLLLLVKPMMGMIIQNTLPVILLTCLVHTLMLCMGMLVLLSTSAGDGTESEHCTLIRCVPVLVCCILGTLAANMIDFALFEPGVLTCFWVMIACAVATYRVYAPAQLQPLPIIPSRNRKAMTGVIAAVLLICTSVGYMPVLVNTFYLYRANRAWANHHTDLAHQALNQGARLDWLSDTAFYQNGRMYLNEYKQSSGKPIALLDKARTCFEQAIRRDPASYRNYEKLTDACMVTDLNAALQAAQQAIQHYPGCARLRVKLAMLYDQLGQTDQAMTAYKAALDIEDQFQQQFKIMYPDSPMIHRLDKEYLDKAMERVGK